MNKKKKRKKKEKKKWWISTYSKELTTNKITLICHYGHMRSHVFALGSPSSRDSRKLNEQKPRNCWSKHDDNIRMYYQTNNQRFLFHRKRIKESRTTQWYESLWLKKRTLWEDDCTVQAWTMIGWAYQAPSQSL